VRAGLIVAHLPEKAFRKNSLAPRATLRVEKCPRYPIGTLAATGMFALVSQAPEADFLVWAWRIPFLVGIVLVGLGLYIRLKLEETPVFPRDRGQERGGKGAAG
jgi:hypothetical protein